MRASRRAVAILPLLVLGAASVVAAPGDPAADCWSGDNDRRISGCSALIETPGLPSDQLSLAYGLRALAYSLKSQFDKALADYDKAIALNPDFAVALNNRAWANFKLGRIPDGEKDVERALRLAPGSAFALDTRAHIKHAQGDATGAFADYELAMRYGGERIVRLYQCGLRAQGFYFGPLDGLYSSSVRRAMRTCVETNACDPLPPDEDCRPTVS